MNRTSPVMVENHEDEQELERNRWNDKEICRNQVLSVIPEKGPPGLRRWLPVPDHVFRDRCLRHWNAEFHELPMNARRTPARIGEAHLTDQIPNFRTNGWATFAIPTLPSPIEAKSLAMPGDDGLWPDHEQRRSPIVPQSREPNPQDPVSPTKTQLVTAARTLQDQELMTESKNLRLQNSTSS